MTKLNVTIKNQMLNHLEQDEELLSFGGFQRRASYIKNRLTFGIASLSNKNFHIGITDRRIIVLPLNYWTNKVEEEIVFSVEFESVEIKGDHLLINLIGENKPLKLQFYFGMKAVTGLDKNEFIGAMYHVKHQ